MRPPRGDEVMGRLPMRLKTKLVITATVMTFAIVITLSALFLGELLRQRIAQTAAANDVLAREVLLAARQAVEEGLRVRPPAVGDDTPEVFHIAVTDALQNSEALNELMNAVVRYSPDVEDVLVADAGGESLAGTELEGQSQPVSQRLNFGRLRDGSVLYQVEQMLGPAHVLDIAVPLTRNGQPFLVVHVGVRSTFLKNSYAPFLRDALWLILFAGAGSVLASSLLSLVVLRPIEAISRRLDTLTRGGLSAVEAADGSIEEMRPAGDDEDAVLRVSATIDRLGKQMQSTKEGYIALQANLDQVLDTLRDGIVLFTPERRAVMVSDAVAHFVGGTGKSGPMIGRRVEEVFRADTALGAAVLTAFHAGAAGAKARVERVELEDGREVEVRIDRFGDGRPGGVSGTMGTMVTLRDVESAARLEQELEVSRRLAAIGRLTAGVGHEVKNPINAMVVHLELLKNKLSGQAALNGAQRHVDIIDGEMQRLDRVVQTLAEFSRPMEVHAREQDMGALVDGVVELTSVEMAEHGVEVRVHSTYDPVMVRVDGELIRQALLNLMLNAMQAMPEGGILRLSLRREGHLVAVDVADSGEGIAPEVMPRIFELYFTTKPKGSGIGLAMTYRILQIHGGALEVRSSVSPLIALEGNTRGVLRGTTFTLRLPYAGAEPRHEFRGTALAGERA